MDRDEALVDLYRDVLKMKQNETVAKVSIVAGAGVDPRRVIKPGKRLRNWHRSGGTGFSLKQYVRVLATNGGDSYALAKRWLASKGARP